MPAKREDITDEAVRRLASYGCTQEEIADFFDTSRSVITGRFGQAFKLGSSDVRKNVRMWQMRNARKGSDKMLIHLGQQYCGQSQKIEQTNRESPAVLKVPQKELNEPTGDQPATWTADEVPSE